MTHAAVVVVERNKKKHKVRFQHRWKQVFFAQVLKEPLELFFPLNFFSSSEWTVFEVLVSSFKVLVEKVTLCQTFETVLILFFVTFWLLLCQWLLLCHWSVQTKWQPDTMSDGQGVNSQGKDDLSCGGQRCHPRTEFCEPYESSCHSCADLCSIDAKFGDCAKHCKPYLQVLVI